MTPTMVVRMSAVLLTLLAFGGSAEAKHRHHARHIHLVRIAAAPAGITQFCGDRVCGGQTEPQGRSLARSARVAHSEVAGGFEGSGEQVIGGRPAGCPHAWCGCGLRLYLGISDTRLNLAWNWTRYYRGMAQVAVWPHHVAMIERHTSPGMAILRDYNSGRGLARIHERSLAGARLVGGYATASR